MNYGYTIGILISLILLIPAALKMYSKISNRRLARKLATGSVGALLRYDYNYAMSLSRMVSEGDLSLQDAAAIADSQLKRNIGISKQKGFSD